MATRTTPSQRAIAERVTRAEAQIEAATSAHREVLDEMASLKKDIQALQLALSKYQGVVGGIMLVGGALTTFFTLFGGFLKDKIFGGS